MSALLVDGAVLRGLPQRSEPERARPHWFGARGQELFAMYHAPAADSCGLGVLLCNPFGYEAMCSHRSYLQLAAGLAQRGFPVLRFDYHGCGDSSGDDRDPERWQAWRASIHTALDELRRLSGCARFGLFGLRLGANLALDAASDRPDVTALALWSPFATGRAFLREELAVHKLRALDPAFDRPETRAEGELEALGFALSAQTVASLEALRTAELRELHARSALIMTRDTALQEKRVAEQLSALGVSVTFAAGSGYGAMLKDNLCPEATWARVIDYFERQLPTPAPDRDPSSRRDRSPDASVWIAGRATAPVREHAGYFGPGERLFGIVTHARGAPDPSAKPALLLLSGGVNHHVGQNRMYTRWARQWAAAGYSSLRFDLAGFGDSAAAHGGGDGKLHSPHSVADVHAAIDHVSRTCGSRQFVLIGLCSGALQGFYAALADSRIVGLGLLNWTRFVLDAPDQEHVPPELAGAAEQRRYHALRYYLRLATEPGVWRRLYEGEIDVRGIADHFARRALGRVRAELKHRLPALFGSARAQTQLARDFATLAARGVACDVVYNGDEPMLDFFHEQLGPHLGRLTRSRALRLDVIDGTDHVFTPLWSQDRVFERMTAHLSALARE